MIFYVFVLYKGALPAFWCEETIYGEKQQKGEKGKQFEHSIYGEQIKVNLVLMEHNSLFSTIISISL